MRIIFLGDSLATQNTGIHFYGLQLVKNMVKHNPDNEFYIVLPKPDPRLKIRQIIVPISKWVPFHLRLRQLSSIPKIVKKFRPDVVIELAHFGPFFLAPSIKRITVVHDLTPISHPEFHSKMSSLSHALLLPGILRKADQIITNSSYTKETIIQKFKIARNKINTIFPSIMPPGELPLKREKSILNLEGPYFLTVGTIEPRKNHLTIIKAFELFSDKHPGYYLVIAGGSGWKNQDVYRYLEKSPLKEQIVLTGYVTRESLWTLYTKALAFIFASFFEGFGLPVLEAQSMGLPLIVSNSPTLLELSQDAGLLFDPNNPGELCNQMCKIAEDEAKSTNLSQASKRAYQNYLNKLAQNDYTFKN